MASRVAVIQLQFKTPISSKDRKRLRPHLSGYNHLNEILLMNGIPTGDLKKLILLEIEGKNRHPIIRRLVGRLKSKERKELLSLIKSCVKVKSKRVSLDTLNAEGVSAISGRRRRSVASPTASSSPPPGESSSSS